MGLGATMSNGPELISFCEFILFIQRRHSYPRCDNEFGALVLVFFRRWQASLSTTSITPMVIGPRCAVNTLFIVRWEDPCMHAG